MSSLLHRKDFCLAFELFGSLKLGKTPGESQSSCSICVAACKMCGAAAKDMDASSYLCRYVKYFAFIGLSACIRTQLGCKAGLLWCFSSLL